MRARVAALWIAAGLLALGALVLLFVTGQPLTALILGLAAIAAGAAAGRVQGAPPPVTPASPLRQVPPPAGPVPSLSDLEGLPFPLTACPDCGYPGVRFPGIRDAVWPGGGETGGRFVCPRCGFQGIPVEFETPRDYQAFLADLHGGAGAG